MLFGEQLYIMDKKTQQGPAGPVVTWSRGAAFEGKMQFDNSIEVLQAQAQGVKVTGYLTVDVDKKGKPIVPLDVNSYVEFPKMDAYARISEPGIIEAGEDPPFQEMQFSVERIAVLPR